MKNLSLTLALAALLSSAVQAQEIRYITDELFVPVRSGQGSQYRIVHRGLPSGTRVTVRESNEESGYSYVITDGGTEGWLLSRYLETDVPAEQQLAALRTEYESLIGDESSLRAQLVRLQQQASEHAVERDTLQRELQATRAELVEVQRISSGALTLDTANRRLTEESQVMQTRIEVLEADNERLQESRESQAFRNGALAVLLGVIIALLVPRLRPQKRSSSSWA